MSGQVNAGTGRGWRHRRAAGVGAWLTMVCSLTAAASPAEPPTATLSQAYQAAETQYQTPGNRAEAMAAYRSLVEKHLANEQLFQSALRRLAEGYAESGQVEEGIRYFVKLLQHKPEGDRDQLLREIFAGFRLKHPEAYQRVVKQMQELPETPTLSTPALSSRELAQAVLQRDDAELRRKTLEKLQAMLAAESDSSRRSAAATLLMSLSAKFDRQPFRPLVVPLLKADDAVLRELALRCLAGLEATGEDLALVLPLAEDASPRVRMAVGGVLIQIAQGNYGDQVVPALMRLLRDSDEKVVEQTIRSMWGQYSEPEFNRLLIELSRRPGLEHNVVYFCLSTMKQKTIDVCQRLVEELDDPDWNNSGRAAWGLGYGVPPEARTLVEEGLLKALPQETNPYTRKEEYRALRGVASEKSRAYLQSVIDSELETKESTTAALEILANLDQAR